MGKFTSLNLREEFLIMKENLIYCIYITIVENDKKKGLSNFENL